MNQTILLVDDDQKLRLLLKVLLEKDQFSVRLAHDGASFCAEFEQFEDEIDLVILDVMLPDTDGFALCDWVRLRSQVPVLMLTASAEDVSRVRGLEQGADDYVSKPYNPRELLARIRAILRRTSLSRTNAAPGPVLRSWSFEGWTLDAKERRLIDPTGADVALTGMDFRLLKLFVEHPGQVLDRSRLMEVTRGRDLGPLDRALDVQISRLRQRLTNPDKPTSPIKTVRGSGYVFTMNVQGVME